jgi:hypothetical protein
MEPHLILTNEVKCKKRRQSNENCWENASWNPFPTAENETKQ